MTVIAGILCALLGSAVWTQALAARARRQVPPQGAFQPIEGANVHFVETGPSQAPTLVLIHGLAGNLQHYTYGMTGLLSDEFHLLVPDRPGSGYSTRDSDARADLEEQARLLWAFLDARGVENPVLVGHSLGGAVALAMALARPGATAGLALLSPATHPQQETPDVFRPLQLRLPLTRRLVAYTLYAPMTRLIRTRVLRKVFAPDPICPEFNTRGGGDLAFRPETFIGASADLMLSRKGVDHLIARYAHDLSLPGAILYAADDRVLSPDHHGDPMAQYGFDVERLPGHGHMLPLTAPEACASFVARLARRATRPQP